MDEDIRKIVKKYGHFPAETEGVPISGKVYDEEEMMNLIKASLEGWWTEGNWVEEFENKLKKFLKIDYVITCNSGSSANLLAITALCSPDLGKKQLKKGDEVITVAAAFPTTINPIIQNDLVPVFLDVSLPTYNINYKNLEKAITKKTKAVMLAHTLGNPFNLKAVKTICKQFDLWLIEDNCDALGSKYEGKLTGTFGGLATLSFYPAHHITTAEGGAVITSNAKLAKIIISLRDWGRHCWCKTGKDNTCQKRFAWKLGNLPEGYDHKYIYSEIGYNLKMSDLHAAIGVAQMDKLNEFIKKRKENFIKLHEKLKKFEKYIILPEATENSEPAWFGFLISIKADKSKREGLMKFLITKKIGTRLLFAGNIIKQPYFTNNQEIKYRVVGGLKNTDYCMNHAFWIGTYPMIDDKMIQKIEEAFTEYFDKD